MMAVPIFTFSLNQKLLPGRVTIGKYDGTHSCLTAATTADKVHHLCFIILFVSSPSTFLLTIQGIVMFCG
jgi:hypothetical protein